MRIVVVHNAYQQPGGEDGVVRREVALLRDAGHEVLFERVSNDSISGPLAKARAFMQAAHNADRAAWMAALVQHNRAELVHVHNFFPLLTPAIHQGAAQAGAAVVQTLHNYRAVCAGAMLLRDGKICEKCLSGNRLWGAVHRCYRGSLPGSLAVTRMQLRADRHRTWHHYVHRFIALTTFSRQKFITGGFPADRIAVKPNFVAQPTFVTAAVRHGALFVGRLAPEKGVHTLIEAWRGLPDLPLTIIGDGPDAAQLRAMAPPNVVFLDEQPAAEIAARMQQAAMLVLPSIWYEGFPMVLLEAFAAGLPVIASHIGSLAELVTPGENGVFFAPGNAEDLRSTVRQLLQQPNTLKALGHGARRTSDTLYTPAQNLTQLEAIYHQAITTARSHSDRP